MRSVSAPLTTVLGATSLVLGTLEITAPSAVESLCRVVGSPKSRRVIRLLGARECGHGAAILLGSPKLVWTRVAGHCVALSRPRELADMLASYAAGPLRPTP